jgi:hypothetical protein
LKKPSPNSSFEPDSEPARKPVLFASEPASSGGLRLAPIPAWQVARQRYATLQRFKQLNEKHNVATAAAMVGASVVSIWRWRRKYEAHGLAGLRPKPTSGGRHSPFTKIRFIPAGIRELERLVVETGSRRAAWRQFASSAACPPAVADHIKKARNAPLCLAGFARIKKVKADCFLSADSKRLYVKLPCRGAVTAAVAVPYGFNPVTLPENA